MTQSRREALEEARHNIATGTTAAAHLRDHAQSEEVRELAKAIHFIGFGAQQIALAFLDKRVDDL